MGAVVVVDPAFVVPEEIVETLGRDEGNDDGRGERRLSSSSERGVASEGERSRSSGEMTVDMSVSFGISGRSISFFIRGGGRIVVVVVGSSSGTGIVGSIGSGLQGFGATFWKFGQRTKGTIMIKFYLVVVIHQTLQSIQ